jgi:hypothetical protein
MGSYMGAASSRRHPAAKVAARHTARTAIFMGHPSVGSFDALYLE